MLQILSEDEIRRIHMSTLEVLEDIGVLFEHAEALAIFERAGAIVDRDRMIVRIHEDLVNEALGKAPKKVTFRARDSDRDFQMGNGRALHFMNGFGAVYVVDLETHTRRSATLKDLEAFTLILDALDNVNLLLPHCIPQEVPGEICDRHMALAMFQNTAKHCAPTTFSIEGARDVIRMASILVGGEEELRRKPEIINNVICPVSPLQYPEDVTARLLEFSKYGIPIQLVSGIVAGATAPCTLAGALVQANAQDLAGLVLSQLIKPGTPILYGKMAALMDQKYGTYVYGCPEQSLINIASAQLTRHYGLPSYNVAGTIDSKLPDEQAAYECMLSNAVTALAGVDIVDDGVYGILESAMTASYEQLIVSHEIASMVSRVVKGFDVTEDTLAVHIIRAVGPGQNYLRNSQAIKHTRKHMLTEHWQPSITDRTTRTEWEQQGSKDIVQRAGEKAREILRTHKPVPLDRDVEAELKRIVKAAEKRFVESR